MSPYLNLEAGWRAAPSARLAACGARYAASGGRALKMSINLLFLQGVPTFFHAERVQIIAGHVALVRLRSV